MGCHQSEHGVETMNFIEQLFAVSPDGGSGSLELAIFVIPILVAFGILGWHRRRRH
jgi:hypothetical protein